MVFSFITCLSIMLLTENKVCLNRTHSPIAWQLAAKLPGENNVVPTGFAGAVNAVDNNVMIVAGGANFPDKLPWEGGHKHYSDAVYVLHKNGDRFVWDKNKSLKLPEPVAYCGNIATPSGIVYAGGENNKGLSNKAFILKWNATDHQLVVKSLPKLPMAVTNVALTNIGNMVYAVGGDNATHSTSLFCALDLKDNAAQWQMLPALPLQLANSVTVAQNGPDGQCIYVIGGRSKMPSGISTLHSSAFRYNISKKEWKACAAVSDGKNVMNFSAGAGVAFGEHSILIMGGDNGVVFHQIETYIAKIKQATSPAKKDQLTLDKNTLTIHHKGFYKGVLLYNCLNNVWTKVGELPFLARVTTTATKWGEDVVLSNGEVKPGVRTPDIMLGKILITEK